MTGANGHKVWESYVIGADPNDKDDSLKITAFPMKADGTPDLDGMEISPAQSKWPVPKCLLFCIAVNFVKFVYQLLRPVAVNAAGPALCTDR